MNEIDNRQIARDSLFILAELRLEGQDESHRVKVRNLSSGGLMAEGDLRVSRGVTVQVNLRNAGWVDGAVAWVQDHRFGVAFNSEIDPKVVRANAIPAPSSNTTLLKRWVAPAVGNGPARKII